MFPRLTSGEVLVSVGPLLSPGFNDPTGVFIFPAKDRILLRKTRLLSLAPVAGYTSADRRVLIGR